MTRAENAESAAPPMPDWSPPNGPWCLRQWIPMRVSNQKVDTCLMPLDHDGRCRGIHGSYHDRQSSMFVGQLTPKAQQSDDDSGVDGGEVVGNDLPFDLPKGITVAVARWFHEAYEQMAPTHGYETRKDSAVPWDQVPMANKALMMDAAAVVLSRLVDAGADLSRFDGSGVL